MSLLYLKHFDLTKPPFQITPDIDFFFSGSQRGGILNALIHVACHEEGIATAVAEVGSGKTLLARLMISRLPEQLCTVYLANPCFSRDEIISAIARDLGIQHLPESMEGKLALLHQELLRRHGLGQRVLLVIDEAHLMPVESIEEVRLLSNLETGQHKLVNIMLFGQPELDMLLADQRLRQVRDRVIHRFELPPMTKDEAASYIDHRLRIAGWQGGRLFSPAATHLLLRFSEGRARRINLLADKSLLAAYADGANTVHKKHVRSACEELQAHVPQTTGWGLINWRTVLAAVALALPMTAAAVWLLTTAKPAITKSSEDPAPPPTAPQTLAPAQTKTPPPKLAPSKANSKVNSPTPSQPASPNSTPQREKSYSAKLDAIVARTDALVENKNMRGFTVQLATLPSMENLEEYLRVVERHVDPARIYAHKRVYGDKPSAAIYVGHYANETEARAAMHALPAALKTHHPIVRLWSRIAKEPRP